MLTTALSLILSSYTSRIKKPIFDEIYIKGKRIDNSNLIATKQLSPTFKKLRARFFNHTSKYEIKLKISINILAVLKKCLILVII